MKRFYLILFLTFIFVLQSKAQSLQWRSEFGEIGNDRVYHISYVDGKFIGGGEYWNDTIRHVVWLGMNDLGDSLYMEYNSNQFPEFHSITGQMATFDQQNFYALLAVPLDSVKKTVLVRCDSNGRIEWTRKFNPNILVSGSHLTVLPDESVIVASERGDFSTYIEIFAMRWDKYGNLLWEKDYVKGGYEYVDRLEVLWDGSILISGRAWALSDQDMYYLNIDVNGNKLRDGKIFPSLNSHRYRGTKIYQLSNKEYFASTWEIDIDSFYLIKLDSALNPEWQIETAYAPVVTEMEDGFILISGNKWLIGGIYDGVLLNIDYNGDTLNEFYDNCFSVMHHPYYYDIAFDGQGGATVAGRVSMPSATNEQENFYFVGYSDVGIPYKKYNHCENPPEIYSVEATWGGDTVVMSDVSGSFLPHNLEVYKQWVLEDGRVIDTNSLSFTFDQDQYPDSFIVQLIATDGINCKDTLEIEVYTNTILGTKSKGTNNHNGILQIYPNPAQGTFNVLMADSESLQNASLEIFDVTGRIVSDFDLLNTGNSIEVKTRNQPKGIYYLLLRNNTGIIGKGKVVLR